MDMNSFMFGVEVGQIVMYAMLMAILAANNKKQRR